MSDSDEDAYNSNTPAPFTPAIASSKQMQSEHMAADDTPVDVNMNAVICRFQAQTTTLAGAEFEAAAARRTIFADKDVKPGP